MKNYMSYAREDVNNAIYLFNKIEPDSTKGLEQVIEELEFAKEYIEKAIKIGKEHR